MEMVCDIVLVEKSFKNTAPEHCLHGLFKGDETEWQRFNTTDAIRSAVQYEDVRPFDMMLISKRRPEIGSLVYLYHPIHNVNFPIPKLAVVHGEHFEDNARYLQLRDPSRLDGRLASHMIQDQYYRTVESSTNFEYIPYISCVITPNLLKKFIKKKGVMNKVIIDLPESEMK